MDKRVRVNAKSSVKGIWTLDVAVEVTGQNILSEDVDVLSIIKDKEREFREDGRTLGGDNSYAD